MVISMVGDDLIGNDAVEVSPFDYSVDNFFAAMDTISSLSGTNKPIDETEIQRFSSMTTFLKEWKYFCYKPKTINLSYEIGSPTGKDVIKGIYLPQFSSATVPKMAIPTPEMGSGNSKDFVLHAGGPVWGLDWCPSVHESFDYKCEYLAVAAHPPDSSYHKMGVPLTGRGIVQIWCLLETNDKQSSSSFLKEKCGKGPVRRNYSTDPNNIVRSHPPKPKGRPRKKPAQADFLNGVYSEDKSFVPRPRGRPRKNPVTVDSTNQMDKVVAVESLADSSDEEKQLLPKRPRGRPRKQPSGGSKKQTVRTESSVCLNGNEVSFTKVGLSSVVEAGEYASTLGNYVLGNMSEALSADPLADAVIKEEQMPPKRRRGRPRKRHVGAECSDGLNGNEAPTIAKLFSISSVVLRENASVLSSVNGLYGSPLDSGVDVGENAFVLASLHGHVTATSEVVLGAVDEALPVDPLAEVDNKEDQSQVKPHILIDTESLTGLDGDEVPNITKVFSSSSIALGEKASVSPNMSGLDRTLLASGDETGEGACSLSSVNGCLSVGFGGGNFVLGSRDEALPLDIKEEHSQLKQHFGRPSERLITTEPSNGLNSIELRSASNFVSASRVHFGKDAPILPIMSGLIGTIDGTPIPGIYETSGRLAMEVCEGFCKEGSKINPSLGTCSRKRRMKDKAKGYTANNTMSPTLSTINEAEELSLRNMAAPDKHDCNGSVFSQTAARKGPLGDSMISSLVQKDILLPKVVLCLAHNGKVAWDVKWKPSSGNCKHCLGYLAVLLGNGCLEVWEVPLPSIVKIIYTSSYKEGTDPRFLKLQPVFRCSKVKCGDRQSIPLTLEWSPSAPSDLIVAGCHDGTVALWKFSLQDASQDTKPLLCFTADRVPIRAIAWAPGESDAESTNLIATAGHEGLKFWDIRDPYHPLWDYNPVQRMILSMDWLLNPRCVILALDDGTLRTINLCKAAYDVPVTGKQFHVKKYQGHFSSCSPFAVWSVHASPLTGLAAYCCADGSTRCFQLTVKSVEDGRKRNRVPHYLCGTLVEEDQALTVNTPLPNTPIPLKESLNKCTESIRSICVSPSDSNQAKGVNAEVQGNEPAPSKSKAAPRTKSAPRTEPAVKEKVKPNEMKAICLYGDEVQGNLENAELSETMGLVVCVDENEEPENSQSRLDDRSLNSGYEVFPPKIIAMHRVRWNTNRGSERWLSYGGAAGIIRCQEVQLHEHLSTNR